MKRISVIHCESKLFPSQTNHVQLFQKSLLFFLCLTSDSVNQNYFFSFKKKTLNKFVVYTNQNFKGPLVFATKYFYSKSAEER